MPHPDPVGKVVASLRLDSPVLVAAQACKMMFYAVWLPNPSSQEIVVSSGIVLVEFGWYCTGGNNIHHLPKMTKQGPDTQSLCARCVRSSLMWLKHINTIITNNLPIWECFASDPSCQFQKHVNRQHDPTELMLIS